jgi:hypothetical protein
MDTLCMGYEYVCIFLDDYWDAAAECWALLLVAGTK